MSTANLPDPTELIAVSRRERQIMDVVYRLGTATAADIHRDLDDPPTYTTVRGLLRVLVEKGQLRIEQAAGRYVYSPIIPREAAGGTMISHIVQTFFSGSPSQAMSALLGAPGIAFSEEELRRLQNLIEQYESRPKAP